MVDIVATLRSKKAFLPTSETTDVQIKDAEKALGLKFAKEYIEYVTAYGQADFYGHQLTGICDDRSLNVIDVTVECRELYKNLPNNMYVVENAYIDGIIICQDEKGTIYYLSPKIEPQKKYETLSEYIANK